MRHRARRLIIEAQPLLKRLLETASIADQVITWGEPEPAWDQQIEITELPRAFRTTVASIPSSVPYLNVGPALRGWSPGLHRNLRIGLVWAASSFNPLRSVELRHLWSWFEIPGLEFHSLQAGQERIHGLDCRGLYTPATHSCCILDLAQTMNQLDLIISVDTMTAHLAGALGRPAWILLPFACDWRWMLHREDSPWYPSMRLFRQPKPHDWESVVTRVREELAHLTQRANLRRSVAPRPNQVSELPVPAK